ncbi:phospho-N-acetylmuramoyl-pentapeptide-transferase [uncultured Finegoldia sp.]|uniref:phospho-N-acetylmuramoyl-pentapeptide- transferase n=1 Tax=uncultured Finegoldia sp. TaxID=328009 RepID=UPI0026274C17|nr:phospho-N-acetylmuramoyl-pentapeptide-transferase [uncultured Finegoldia sp.]
MDLKNEIILSMLVAIVISLILGKFIIKILRQKHIGQEIRDDGPKSHYSKAGTPTMGGIIFIISTLITVLIFRLFDSEILLAIYGMIAFGSIGFIDDFMKLVMKRSLGLNEKQKLILQLLFSIIACFLLKKVNPNFTKQEIPFLNMTVDFGIITYPFLIFVMMGTSNATNLTDGLDGLATSVSVPVFIATSFIMYHLGSRISVFSIIFAGSLLGFLVYNSNPAKVFMGDTGSMAIGGALVMMMATYGLSLYLIILGFVYMIEVLSVIIQMTSYKLRNKKRVFLMSPIHHHYELKGYKEQKIVSTFMVVSIITSLITLIDLL